jgi:hypothetical protein
MVAVVQFPCSLRLLAAPAVRLRQQPLSPVALAPSPARRDGLPQRRAARRGAARRGLDRQRRRGEAEDFRVLRGRGPRDGPSGKAGSGETDSVRREDRGRNNVVFRHLQPQ